nr:unnamed protein product [Digitaria exilis]
MAGRLPLPPPLSSAPSPAAASGGADGSAVGATAAAAAAAGAAAGGGALPPPPAAGAASAAAGAGASPLLLVPPVAGHQQQAAQQQVQRERTSDGALPAGVTGVDLPPAAGLHQQVPPPPRAPPPAPALQHPSSPAGLVLGDTVGPLGATADPAASIVVPPPPLTFAMAGHYYAELNAVIIKELDNLRMARDLAKQQVTDSGLRSGIMAEISALLAEFGKKKKQSLANASIVLTSNPHQKQAESNKKRKKKQGHHKGQECHQHGKKSKLGEKLDNKQNKPQQEQQQK